MHWSNALYTPIVHCISSAATHQQLHREPNLTYANTKRTWFYIRRYKENMFLHTHIQREHVFTYAATHVINVRKRIYENVYNAIFENVYTGLYL